jgi:hypothetical protein
MNCEVRSLKSEISFLSHFPLFPSNFNTALLIHSRFLRSEEKA